jgi:acetoin utilization deacetylase AcuC-like enzyme
VGDYYYGMSHPMKPHRVRMAHDLIVRYGLYKQLQVYKPLHASLDEMAAFHHRDYLEYLTVADRGGDRVGARGGLGGWGRVGVGKGGGETGAGGSGRPGWAIRGRERTVAASRGLRAHGTAPFRLTANYTARPRRRPPPPQAATNASLKAKFNLKGDCPVFEGVFRYCQVRARRPGGGSGGREGRPGGGSGAPAPGAAPPDHAARPRAHARRPPPQRPPCSRATWAPRSAARCS